MTHFARLLTPLATLLTLVGCAGSGGGWGIPQCAPDRGAVEAPVVKPGDLWSYGQLDDYTKIHQGVFALEATGVTADSIEARLTLPGSATSVAETYDRTWAWKTVSNRNWDWLSRLAYGSQTVAFSPPFDTMPFPLRVGQSWSDNVVAINPATGVRIPIQISSTARCWESITVPAGGFVALRIERMVYLQDLEWYKSQTTLRQVDWYLPEINRFVMTWHDSYYYDYRQGRRNQLTRGDRLRWELIEYKAGGK